MKFLKNRKAEGYIDIAVAVLVVAFVLIFTVSIWSMVTLKQDMRYMCNELIETATATGRIGPEVQARYVELCAEAGITPEVSFDAVYYDSSTGKVQLGEIISCTLKHRLTLPGFGGYTFPFDVEITQSGLSRIYWK